jgi:hypothetical protein
MKTGEIKMNAIQIINKNHEQTSWKRYITFNYDDKEYKVLLFWDEFNGYELYWRNNETELLNSLKAPQWAIEWDEDANNGESLSAYLDELTFNAKEKDPNEDLFNELISSAEKLIELTGGKQND